MRLRGEARGVPRRRPAGLRRQHRERQPLQLPQALRDVAQGGVKGELRTLRAFVRNHRERRVEEAGRPRHLHGAGTSERSRTHRQSFRPRDAAACCGRMTLLRAAAG